MLDHMTHSSKLLSTFITTYDVLSGICPYVHVHQVFSCGSFLPLFANITKHNYLYINNNYNNRKFNKSFLGSLRLFLTILKLSFYSLVCIVGFFDPCVLLSYGCSGCYKFWVFFFTCSMTCFLLRVLFVHVSPPCLDL